MASSYCCAVYFILVVGVRQVRMLSGDWFCLCGCCFSPVFKKRKFAPGPKNGTHEDHITHTEVLWLKTEWAKRLQIFFAVRWPIVLRVARDLRPIIAESNTYEKQPAFIHYARRFDYWKCFQRPEIFRCSVSSIHWIYSLKTCLLLQTDDSSVNTAQYCL